MSRRHAGISRSHGTLGWFGSKHLDVSQGPSTVATARPAPPPAIVRVHHPVVPAPEFKCFRVVRYYKQDGLVQVESIGHSKTATPALLLMGCEIGKARVIGPDGKQFSDNYQPMEVR